MWLFKSIADHFTEGFSELRLAHYAQALGVAVLWKTLVSIGYGEWRRLRRNGYAAWTVARRHGKRVAVVLSATHQAMLVLRLLACAAVLLNIGRTLAFAVLVFTLSAELLYEFRFNTVYLTLCSAVVMLSQLPSIATLGVSAAAWRGFAAALIVLITSSLYLNSAWLKLHSRQFRSGLMLAQLAYVAAATRNLQPRWDYWIPSRLVSEDAARGNPQPSHRLLAVGVIATEAALPFGLLSPFWLLFAVVGALLHLGFLALLPIRLLPFSLLCVASYPLFLGPR